MPDLRCTVQTCTHNQNYYCNLDSIVVGGNSAKKADETSCDSFEERIGVSTLWKLLFECILGHGGKRSICQE
mgnify:CR=1 FL=1